MKGLEAPVVLLIRRSYTEIDNCLIAYAYLSGDGSSCSGINDAGRRTACQEIAAASG